MGTVLMDNSSHIFRNNELNSCPLVIDSVYEAPGGSMSYEPLSKIFGCANQGGFRAVKDGKGGYKFIVLYSSLDDIDWPDSVDIFGGLVTYYGDNKRPGNDIHKTSLGGNRILREYFDYLHGEERHKIAPIFLFSKGVKGRDAVFRGLIVPGGENLGENEDLVAVWRSKGGQRFQNYRAIFTILDTGTIPRSWIDDLHKGQVDTGNAPQTWINWRNSTLPPKSLRAEKVSEYRSKDEQLPNTGSSDFTLLNRLYEFYRDDPFQFELCAAEIVLLMDKSFTNYEVTRRSRDGGIDGRAEYKIGLASNSISVSCAIEAKCYKPGHSVGVKETSRLISRLRFRQFGVLVTTSYVHSQAYKEIIDDQHPVVIISGKDIVSILSQNNIRDEENLVKWMKSITEKHS